MAKGLVATTSVVIEADKNKVWEALIDPVQIKHYLFGTEAISDWKVGSPITYKGSWNGQEYEDKGTILEMDPGKKYVSTYWSGMAGKADVPENYATVTYELAEADGKTTVTLSQDNLPDDASVQQAMGNWGMVLGGLKKLLES